MTMDDWWVDFVAGWASGAAGVATCQPLDTVLTRFQAGMVVNGTTTSTSVGAVSIRGFAREFGIRSLWRGSSPMIGVVPFQNALLMGGYGFGKKYSEWNPAEDVAVTVGTVSTQQQHRLLPVFVGGCAGGVLQSFVVSPVEWIKVQQQTGVAAAAANQRQVSSTTFGLAKILWHGDLQLWNRGLTATLLRDGIPHGVWFASYEFCKTQMLLAGRSNSNEQNNDSGGFGDESSLSLYERVSVPLASGAFAATTAWAVGYPFDIIKTRIQAASVEAGRADSGRSNSVPGLINTAQQLVTEADGRVLRGLYRGFGWKLLRSVPASMIGFLSYEVVSEALT